MRSEKLKIICRTFCILHFAFCFFSMPVFALNFDTSLDDEIRKNYNPNKIDEDMALPALPKILKEENEGPIKPVSQTKKVAPPVAQKQQIQTPQLQAKTVRQENFEPEPKQTIYSGNSATLRQGTKIRVKMINSISDKTRKGTKLTFVSQYPVSTTYFTIPKGTIFNGVVADSHRPQLSGNGGLIVIKVNSMTLNDGSYKIDANVTKANYKYIFFNNIKGKRKYIKSMIKSTKPGLHFCKKMMSITGNFLQDGSSAILAPFSLCFGAIAASGNIIASPALALFYKGDHIYLRDGSDFEIKLMQDLIIYN